MQEALFALLDVQPEQQPPIVAQTLSEPSAVPPAKLVSLAEVDAIHREILANPGDVERVRSGFRSVLDSMPALRAELNALKVADLKKRVDVLFRGHRHAEYVDYVAEKMVTRFGFYVDPVLSIPMFSSPEKVVAGKLAALTPERLSERVGEMKAAIQAALDRRIAMAASVRDPKTLADFELRARITDQPLAPELQDRHDNLLAQALLVARASKESASASVAVEVHSAARLIQSCHTKSGEALWVVQLVDRVDKEKFLELTSAARRLGGYYSSYSRDGAVPGFTFRDAACADQFIEVVDGERVNSEHMLARASVRAHSRVEALRAASQSLEASANERLEKERKVNTARRVRMAETAEREAKRDLAKAQTMRRIADAVEAGVAPLLELMREVVQVDVLESIYLRARADAEAAKVELTGPNDLTIARFAKMPFANFYGQVVPWAALRSARGTKRLVSELEALAQKEDGSSKKTIVGRELLERMEDALGVRAKDEMPWFWREILLRLRRLERMEITRVEILREALRQFIPLRESAQALDALKAAERALVGARVGVDFFPTPGWYADTMVTWLNPQPGERGLEPNGGSGNIAEAIRRAGIEPEVCEISSQLRDLLVAKGFDVVADDLLAYQPEERYAFCAMNPPWSAGMDMAHVMHVTEHCLAPGGRLAAIVGAGALQNSSTKHQAFKDWLQGLEEQGAQVMVEDLPEGLFEDRTLLATTSARGKLLKIQLARV